MPDIACDSHSTPHFLSMASPTNRVFIVQVCESGNSEGKVFLSSVQKTGETRENSLTDTHCHSTADSLIGITDHSGIHSVPASEYECVYGFVSRRDEKDTGLYGLLRTCL